MQISIYKFVSLVLVFITKDYIFYYINGRFEEFNQFLNLNIFLNEFY